MIPLGVLGASRQQAGGALEIAFLGSDLNNADQSSYTFPGMPLGADDASRRIIVAVGLNATNAGPTSRTLSSVTVAGAPLTVDATQTGCAWIGRADPSGSSGDVVVTLSGGAAPGCYVALWRASQDASPSDATTFDPVGTSQDRSVLLAYSRSLTADQEDDSVQAEDIGVRQMFWIVSRGATTYTGISYAPIGLGVNYG